MRYLTGIVFACMFAVTGAVRAWPADDPAEVWNLAHDISATGNQISFAQGSREVWYFMESHSVTHDPTLYRFLPDYNAPALAFGGPSGIVIPEGFSCWQDPEVIPDVCFNFNTKPVTLEQFQVPPRTVDMHPGIGKLSIIAWRSPIGGSISIKGEFKDLDSNCGNGVLWSIERTYHPLKSGELLNGGAQKFDLEGVKVNRGDVLYFIVDPNGDDYVCDSTSLDLTIAQAKKHD